MTKSQRAMYDAYKNASMVTIWDAYNNPSPYKILAYEECVNECIKVFNGGPWVIPTRNTRIFTFAFTYHADNDYRLRYYTASNVYDFSIKEVTVC